MSEEKKERMFDFLDNLRDSGICNMFGSGMYLEEMFDHTTAVASDDPHLDLFKQMDDANVLTLRIFSAVGCEKFAETVYLDVAPLVAARTKNRVRLKSVEVFEHGSNSAIYEG